MTIPTPFTAALVANIHVRIARLRRDGTVSMSIANLLQVTPTPQSNLQGAPRGTNAAYYYKQLFREVCVSDPRIASFVRDCEQPATPAATEGTR